LSLNLVVDGRKGVVEQAAIAKECVCVRVCACVCVSESKREREKVRVRGCEGVQ